MPELIFCMKGMKNVSVNEWTKENIWNYVRMNNNDGNKNNEQ